MVIAVTAASGRLGNAVIAELLDLNPSQEVVGLARTPGSVEADVEVRPGDYADAAQLRAALHGVATLLLVSGNEAPDARVVQHRNVLAAARETGVRKVVYTSVQGADQGTAFSPVVASNRQTEADLRSSGIDWVIGRNGIYVEPDLEALDAYVAAGEVANCAGEGRCGYTTRPALARAYAQMLTSPEHDGRTYRLHGEPITQAELVDHLNTAFGTDLVYRPMEVQEYVEDRTAALGPFMGTIIAGIYEGIRLGAHDQPSDYETATGRHHPAWDDVFAAAAAAAAGPASA